MEKQMLTVKLLMTTVCQNEEGEGVIIKKNAQLSTLYSSFRCGDTAGATGG